MSCAAGAATWTSGCRAHRQPRLHRVDDRRELLGEVGSAAQARMMSLNVSVRSRGRRVVPLARWRALGVHEREGPSATRASTAGKCGSRQAGSAASFPGRLRAWLNALSPRRRSQRRSLRSRLRRTLARERYNGPVTDRGSVGGSVLRDRAGRGPRRGPHYRSSARRPPRPDRAWHRVFAVIVVAVLVTGRLLMRSFVTRVA